MRARIKHILSTVLVLTLAAAFAGCGDVDSNNDVQDNGPVVSEQGLFEAHVTPDPSQPSTGDNTLMLHVMDMEDNGVEGLALDVEPWMPHHGHGSPEEPVVMEKDNGMYMVTNLVYSMPGRWEVRIDVDDGEVSDRFVLKYSVQ